MLSRQNVLIGVTFSAVCTLALIFYPYPEPLTFSNTQIWGDGYYAAAISTSSFSQAQLNILQLPDPPGNKSAQVQKELDALHQKISLRTPEKIEEIRNEISVKTSVYGTTTLETFVNNENRPYTTQLIEQAYEKIGPTILWIKLRYDRVRPTYLDQTLTAAIEIPTHASYPSGHATQSHVVASLLSLLDPDNRNIYFESAKRITHNREIAGLHYPSDSAAGVALAEQLLIFLHDDLEFVQLLEKAKTEWQ